MIFNLESIICIRNYKDMGIPMGTNCALLADLFLYSHEADFI